jgi:hypothetical protein
MRPSQALKELRRYIRERALDRPEPWVSSSVFERVSEAAEAAGSSSANAIARRLEEEVDAASLALCAECLKVAWRKA